ncbi:nuclear transport factor 2 family protein [Uniformispora flossi]|uniref:nuclear transport factor 2 family protein n=1 Tax=Uniformispora flossi TaxID=3390723 RepID=UPI003C2DFF4E
MVTEPTGGLVAASAREREDHAQIRDLIESWVLYRDSADWEAFRGVWHSGAWMTATWFQGPAEDFVEASRAGFDAGVEILHALGGFTCRSNGSRAIAHTRMSIQQRGEIDAVLVDVTCVGRFYDFLEHRDGKWGLVRRQPAYDRDRLDTVDPLAELRLDPAILDRFPVGYRHLAYLQEQAGYRVHQGLPGLRGAEIDQLYREGDAWLAGSARPGRYL